MLTGFLKKIFGSRNERLLRQYRATVARINALEPAMEGLSDEQLTAKTTEFKERYAQDESLDDLLPEAFAVVREAGKRVLGMRHFDVQLVGGMVLHYGKIAEMRTGEGKTLVATLPSYLNAISGKGVHVVTVNDYLARRDAEWMSPLYRGLGLTVGVIVNDLAQSGTRGRAADDGGRPGALHSSRDGARGAQRRRRGGALHLPGRARRALRRWLVRFAARARLYPS